MTAHDPAAQPPTQPRVLLFTGEGKGKTTAALGLALRAAGHGLRVCIVQFVKADGTGESAACKTLRGLEILQTGLGFIPPPTHPRFAAHVQAAHSALEVARDRLAGGVDVLVLDEVCVAVDKNLIDFDELAGLLRLAAPDTIIVLTGRGASEELVALADTVTEMRCVKHGFRQGIKAQKGVEF